MYQLDPVTNWAVHLILYRWKIALGIVYGRAFTYLWQDPVPSEQWTGIRDAVKFGNACGQFDITSKRIVGSDDCLYLNVYVPSTDEKENDRRNLPVMVYFHGGAFIFGSGDNFLYGPDYLIKKDVVVVTVNYRLGVLGEQKVKFDRRITNSSSQSMIFLLSILQDS